MSRSFLVGGLFIGLVVLASMIAPPPAALAQQQTSGSGSTSSGGPGGGNGNGNGKSHACQGLSIAYDACLSNNGSHAGCLHIAEQLAAHGCSGSSSAGSGKN